MPARDSIAGSGRSSGAGARGAAGATAQRHPLAVLRHEARPRETVAACVCVVLLAALPAVLWHGLISDIAHGFRWQLGYALAEGTPWVLLASGVAFLIPVAISSGRPTDSRLYPRSRRAYLAWGAVLYLLGMILAIQLAQVAAPRAS